MTGAVVTLTTDFGHQDPYVGVMKGVILGINPEAQLVDLCHEIGPQDVEEAAWAVGTSYRYFPRGSVHLVVVDPGVGSDRRGVALQTDDGLFVAPDNGVLNHVLDLSESWRAVEIRDSRYWLPVVSKTFHGRDILAPVAAHLSKGVRLEELGPPATDLQRPRLATPQRREDGSLVGRVVHVDRFGNLITNLKPGHLPTPVSNVVFEIAGQSIVGLSGYYAQGSGLMALEGSTGRIEIALPMGSAAVRLGVGRGEPVVVQGA